ncbi:hypothetical protein [Hymenobacter guriensis]|uniref:Uncharacterized protein n=1 Tax=Hymenobacter guriensis TaxID=2793065 RepID=A0ABS0L0M5_9BACT|nr:hypothetical protein [Hymenobacter guriensis]MBG8553108.1 hypothetical protein [Hymenobacter guriensis]
MYRLLYVLALLALPDFVQAQTPVAPDTSVWRDTGPKTPHGLAMLKMADGRAARAYFPVNRLGFEKAIDYFPTNPKVRPFPKIKYLDVDQLASATIRGYYYENMRAAGEPDVLAVRLIEGPVELFALRGTAASKVPVLLSPVSALASVAALGLMAVDNNRWFLRRNGQLVAITHGKFRPFMTEYTADCPALSEQVRTGIKGFQHNDMPEIIRLYNEFLLSSAGK